MNRLVFEKAPSRVYWELTRACDLACRHCRAEAIRQRGRDELSTEECLGVMRSLARAGRPTPHLVLTGGDPLKRPDLLDLVRGGVDLGLGVSVAPSATTSLTRGAIDELKRAGVEAMSLSIDGPTAAQHDAVRQVLGCFGWTLVAAQRIVRAGIPLQVNTLVTADTERHLESIGDLVARIGARRWSLFFLIEVGRGRALRGLTPPQAEWTLGRIAATSPRWPFVTTTTEAPFYRRVLIQQMREAGKTGREILGSPVARGFGVRDGNGVMFIAANGDVTPSGFLPLIAGNVRHTDPVTLYRKSPLFRSLRDPSEFAGRCGVCSFHHVCGGSRARAWAATGDVLGEDPLCAWVPAEPAGDRAPAEAVMA